MRLLFAILFIPFATVYSQESNYPGFHITIGLDSLFANNPVVIMENDKFVAVMRNCDRILHKYGSTDVCIRDWLSKSSDTLYTGFCMTGNPRRNEISEMQLTYDGPQKKELIVQFGPRSKFYKRFTLLKDSSVIKVEYLKYHADSFSLSDSDSLKEIPNWYKEVMLFFGGDKWVRANKTTKESYWNTERKINSIDCSDIEMADIGWSLYKGHLITIIGNSFTGLGFGEIMPDWNIDQGTDLNKVFWEEENVTFPTTASREFENHLPLTGYIFVFSNGVPNAFIFGKEIVDIHLDNNSSK